jgi:signal transduction histidine kinase
LHLIGMCPDDPEMSVEARRIMERQIAHMVRLVDDLMDVSRISRGKVALQIEPVEASQVVQSAIETCQPAIQAAQHQLDIKLPAEPVVLRADMTRLAQVLANLLSNAIKYSPPGSMISIGVEPWDGEVCFVVRDTGIGMTAELLPHVFDLFVQADRSLDRSQGGLGIGLTLVKNLVELHGGRVEALSPGPGLGSEFRVYLPRHAPASGASRTISAGSGRGES